MVKLCKRRVINGENLCVLRLTTNKLDIIFTRLYNNKYMETKFILLIICGGIFIATLIAYTAVSFLKKRKEEAKAEELAKMYADKNLAKMEYDCAVYDEETEKLLDSRQRPDGQMTIEEVVKSEAAFAEGSVFQTVEKEGIEEIRLKDNIL